MPATWVLAVREMPTVGWLCLIALVFLICGAVYALAVGKRSAGPFTLNKQDNPLGFYLTLLAVVLLALMGLRTVWLMYLDSIVS